MPRAANNGVNWQVLAQTIAQMYPQLDEARNQRRQAEELAAGQRAMAGRQAMLDRQIGDEIAATAADTPDRRVSESLAGYDQALKQVRARGNASKAPASGRGETFEQDRAAADQQRELRGRESAGYLSEVQGAARMRQDAGARQSRLASSAQTTGRHAQMDQFLAELRARRQRSNPWVPVMAGVLSRIATNYQRPMARPNAGLPSVGGGTPVIDVSGGFDPARTRSA